MKKQLKNYGFIEPVILGSDYRFGGGFGLTTGKPILCPDRDWTPYLPAGEIQRRIIETSSCTEFGTNNAIESIIKVKFGIDIDLSERFPSIGAGNNENGNDPNKVAQWIHDNGAIKEALLPFTDEIKSWAEYMTPNPLPKKLTKEGKRWGYDFKHEWVDVDPEKLWSALQYSPLGVSVVAWIKDGAYYIKPEGMRDNHWTLLIGGVYKKSFRIFDSYIDDDYFKDVPWDYKFGYAKLYALDIAKLSFFNRFIQKLC